jgi:hypothetical protein
MRRSILALIGSLVGLAYLGLVAFVLSRMWDLGAFSLSALGREIRIARLLPFLVAVGLADLAGWIGFFTKKRAFSLVSALLYGAAVPVLPQLVYASAALTAFMLADFLFYPTLNRKREKPAPEAAQDTWDTLPSDDADTALPDDATLSPDGEEPPDALEPGESEEDIDIQEETDLESESPAWLDDEDEVELAPPERTPADGTGVFLGVFMAIAALVLVGVVVYGLMIGKLPFMP